MAGNVAGSRFEFEIETKNPNSRRGKSVEKYKMVIECCRSYRVTNLKDGGAEIRILTSARFADLWKVKLSSLHTDDLEIAEYERGQTA